MSKQENKKNKGNPKALNYVNAINRAMDSNKISRNAFLVWWALYHKANCHGWPTVPFITIQEIADFTQLSKRTLQPKIAGEKTPLDELQDFGLIRFSIGRYRGTATTFELLIPEKGCKNCALSDNDNGCKECNSFTERAQKNDIKGAKSMQERAKKLHPIKTVFNKTIIKKKMREKENFPPRFFGIEELKKNLSFVEVLQYVEKGTKFSPWKYENLYKKGIDHVDNTYTGRVENGKTKWENGVRVEEFKSYLLNVLKKEIENSYAKNTALISPWEELRFDSAVREKGFNPAKKEDLESYYALKYQVLEACIINPNPPASIKPAINPVENNNPTISITEKKAEANKQMLLPERKEPEKIPPTEQVDKVENEINNVSKIFSTKEITGDIVDKELKRWAQVKNIKEVVKLRNSFKEFMEGPDLKNGLTIKQIKSYAIDFAQAERAESFREKIRLEKKILIFK